MLTKQYRKPAGNLYRFSRYHYVIIHSHASLNSSKIKQSVRVYSNKRMIRKQKHSITKLKKKEIEKMAQVRTDPAAARMRSGV